MIKYEPIETNLNNHSLLFFEQAPEVSKRASQRWKSLSAEDRLHWDNEAAKEKQRYLAEKEVYTGPVSSNHWCDGLLSVPSPFSARLAYITDLVRTNSYLNHMYSFFFIT